MKRQRVSCTDNVLRTDSKQTGNNADPFSSQTHKTFTTPFDVLYRYSRRLRGGRLVEYSDVWFVPKEPVASIAGGFLDNTEIGKPGD